jgi:hypothetical protein
MTVGRRMVLCDVLRCHVLSHVPLKDPTEGPLQAAVAVAVAAALNDVA